MGNITSYSCFSPSKGKTALLMDTQGNIREIKVPTISAEIMIEEIGHVVTSAEELLRTRRISALPADRELLAGKTYLLVPASRVHSKASEFEMAISEKSGERKKKTSRNGSKVSPVSTVSEKDGEIEVSGFPGKLVGISCHQLRTRGLRWNPVLEPILESH